MGRDERKAVKGTRFLLLKNRRNLTREERRKLSTLEHTNRRPYRAYLLKEALAAVFE